jgi:hypothetical protein
MSIRERGGHMIKRSLVLIVVTALLAASSCDRPRDPLDQPAPDNPVEPHNKK